MGDRLLMKCPKCGDPNCEAEGVDIGVGIQQSGPYCCEVCGYIQPREVSEETMKLLEEMESDLPF